jgi:hypothetical protein
LIERGLDRVAQRIQSIAFFLDRVIANLKERILDFRDDLLDRLARGRLQLQFVLQGCAADQSDQQAGIARRCVLRAWVILRGLSVASLLCGFLSLFRAAGRLAASFGPLWLRVIRARRDRGHT